MAFAFPPNPTVGQEYTSGGVTYVWSSYGWAVKGDPKVSKAGDSMSGSLLPTVTGTINLGSAALRWGTVYTSDLSLSNGVGDWTIVEGEDDLFIYNNRNSKVYKFMLYEVAPATAPSKKV